MIRILIALIIINFTYSKILAQESSSIFHSLGWYSMKEKNYEEALENFQLSIEYNEPKIKESTIEIGTCHKILGNYKKAVEWGKKALQYDLAEWEKARVYRLIGISYGYLEDYKSAFNYFDMMKKTSDIFDIPNEFMFVKDGWYYIIHAGYDDIYYNRGTIRKKGKGKITVWLKWFWDEKSVLNEDFSKIFSYGNNTEAYNHRIDEIIAERKNVIYSLTYSEYDFTNYRTKLLEVIEYDKKGDILKSVTWSEKENNWINIVPGSVGEIIFNSLKEKYNR